MSWFKYNERESDNSKCFRFFQKIIYTELDDCLILLQYDFAYIISNLIQMINYSLFKINNSFCLESAMREWDEKHIVFD